MDILKDLQEQLIIYYHSFVSTLPKIMMGVIFVILLLYFLGYIRRKLIKAIDKRVEDKLLVEFFNNILGIVNVVLALLFFLFTIDQVGLASSLLGAATVSSFVIGFAFKDIAENFLAGVIMAFNRPFRIGDTVKTGDVEGVILELSLRDTHLKTFDGKDVYVPNGQIIKNPLYNYTIDGFMRKQFVIGVDYGTDIDKARAIVLDVLKSSPGIIQDTKPPQTLISDLGTSTVNITAQYWIDTFDSNHSVSEIQSQAMKNVLNNMEAEGINMPGDVIELKNYNDNPITTGIKNEAV